MADTLTVVKGSHRRVFSKILQRILRSASYTTAADGSLHSLRLRRWQKEVWVSASADPSVDSGSQGTFPVKIGNLVYREDTDEVFICSVAPAASTDATFIQMHA